MLPVLQAPPVSAGRRTGPNSQINALANYCSLVWTFRYVHRAEPEFGPGSLVFGTTFHGALSYQAARRMRGRDCTIGECADLLESLLAGGCRPVLPRP